MPTKPASIPTHPRHPSSATVTTSIKTEGQRLLLIAPHSSYRITPYLKAAQQLGVEVLIASTSEHSLVSAIAEGLHIDLQQPESALESILTCHKQQPFTGVVATDDGSVSLAASAAHVLGLPYNPPQAVLFTHRKDLARARLAEQGVPVPKHRLIDLQLELDSQLTELDYPCVFKPLSLSGSRGVIRADNPQAAREACERIARIVCDLDDNGIGDDDSRHFLLAEDYIPGMEVAVEGMLHDGRLQLLALFDKPDAMEGPFFEETYYITPSCLPQATQQQILRRAEQACAAYGLRHGPVHAELRLFEEEAWILEVAARTIGGQCARLLQFGTGHNLEELVIAQATGRALRIERGHQAAGVLMIPIPRAGVLRRVEGLGAAQRVPYITDLEISVRDGYELVPLPEGSAYLGFIFAQGPDPLCVEQALRQAHACLNIVTAPLWKFSQ